MFESMMSVVWSRQRKVQRTFGTTVSIAGVRSEGALCECHELKANFDASGPSPVSSRGGHDSPLGAVLIQYCSATFPKQDVLLEEWHKEGNVSKCDCTHDCSGSR